MREFLRSSRPARAASWRTLAIAQDVDALGSKVVDRRRPVTRTVDHLPAVGENYSQVASEVANPLIQWRRQRIRYERLNQVKRLDPIGRRSASEDRPGRSFGERLDADARDASLRWDGNGLVQHSAQRT